MRVFPPARLQGFKRWASSIQPTGTIGTTGESTLHPDKYLAVALKWPTEAQEPSNYLDKHSAQFYPTKIQHPNPDGSDSQEYGATLINPTMTKVFSCLVAGILVYRINDYYFGNYPVHPLTSAIGVLLEKFSSKIDEREAFYFDLIKNEQDERLLYKEELHFVTPAATKHYKKPKRLLSVGLLETNAAPALGSYVDTSNVKWKHTWEENDEINKVLKELY